jgi:hypothetical protein
MDEPLPINRPNQELLVGALLRALGRNRNGKLIFTSVMFLRYTRLGLES